MSVPCRTNTDASTQLSVDQRSCEFNTALRNELLNDFNNVAMIAAFGHERCVQWIEQILASTASTPAFTVLRINTIKTDVTPAHALHTIRNIVKNHEAFLHPELPDVIVLSPSTKDDVPKSPKAAQVIVDVKCGSAVLRGAHVFIPGVLSAPHDMQIGDEVSVYADVESTCLRGSIARFEGRKIFVGNGIAKLSRRDLFVNQINHGVAVEMSMDSMSPCPSLEDIPDDFLFAQNLPSIVSGHVLGAKAGEYILDMCAAPGGKCTHLAALMNNMGVIVALDKTASKIEKIKSNCSKLGVKCIHPFVFDATKAWDPTSLTADLSHDVCGPPYASGIFDRVLLDAPCSALGQRPQLANRMFVKELHSYPKLQRKLIANAVELVKTRGVLVYSTCTFTFLENESIIEWTLKKYPYMELIHQEPHLGGKGFPFVGLSSDETNRLQRYGVQKQLAEKRQYDVDTIGFFIAKFVKNSKVDL